jgi:hypothetical protein
MSDNNVVEQFWREYYKDDPNFPPSEAACEFAEAYHKYISRRAAVPTRLTAEQFLSSRFEPDPNEPNEDTYWLHFPNGIELVENRAFWKKHLAELLEAFRDKSEATLREEIERLKQLAGTPTANLWKQLKDEQAYSLKATREAAALREAERWIPVEEKLPEKSDEYQVVESCYAFASVADYNADDKAWFTVRGFGYDSEVRELHNVTHWKALSAAPEPTKEKIESMTLATEPCPDCGSRHHRSCVGDL